ncbi:MAG: NPCBM/NEW2 domain-containing protein, partial [Thermoguttaceae bacterium]|nr:NPCBM/NEW2 domain-containing protein [Thermoguttaceae bacterium]
MKIFRCCLIFHILFFLSFTSLRGLEPTTVELTERAEWAAAKFDLTSPNIVEIVQRIVVVANHAPVQLDNRYGRPMKMGEDTYTNGLYCHAPSHLDIKLEQPATKFKAIIGIDDNENTSTGGGTVQFIVRIGNRDIFTSDIIRSPQAGLPIEVPLDNVREFSLIVTDAGDGISCDQSDWANAAVELADGTTLFLSSLPLIQEKESKTNETLYPFEFTYNGRSSHD